jgi:formate hydrogenlyase subunit 3/multisubunit Na+/H+ antiporter MnhD subunit
MEKLGGLHRLMLFTAVVFLIGSFAISGLPPFNSFTGKFLLYWGMIKGVASSE